MAFSLQWKDRPEHSSITLWIGPVWPFKIKRSVLGDKMEGVMPQKELSFSPAVWQWIIFDLLCIPAWKKHCFWYCFLTMRSTNIYIMLLGSCKGDSSGLIILRRQSCEIKMEMSVLMFLNLNWQTGSLLLLNYEIKSIMPHSDEDEITQLDG